MIEKKVNEYGQIQKIRNFDKIIKIGNKLLQVRLIETERFRQRGKFGKPMPRAKFIRSEEFENPYYLIKKSDVIKLKEESKNGRSKRM